MKNTEGTFLPFIRVADFIREMEILCKFIEGRVFTVETCHIYLLMHSDNSANHSFEAEYIK